MLSPREMRKSPIFVAFSGDEVKLCPIGGDKPGR
jgi:hypothetical protein